MRSEKKRDGVSVFANRRQSSVWRREITPITPTVQGIARIHDERIRHIRHVPPFAGLRRDLQAGHTGLGQKGHKIHTRVRRDTVQTLLARARGVM